MDNYDDTQRLRQAIEEAITCGRISGWRHVVPWEIDPECERDDFNPADYAEAEADGYIGAMSYERRNALLDILDEEDGDGFYTDTIGTPFSWLHEEWKKRFAALLEAPDMATAA